ncbi:MAG: hypothetical protein AB4352_09505 [Hormoscilla sp.]
MNNKDDRELQRKLQQMEAKINSQFSPELKSEVSRMSEKVVNWYRGLPTAGKLAVIGAGLFGGLTVLNMLVHMVASLVSIAFLALLAYIVYKIFLADNPSSN